MEKIHGTSSHITWKNGQVFFFSGGANHQNFIKLFDIDTLSQIFRDFGHGDDCEITVYGEAHGGKEQGMGDVYGKDLKFVAFEAKVDTYWLSVPKAEKVAHDLGQDFVAYEEIEFTLSAIDAERDRDSVQAVKNGMGEGHKREGVVLRPLEELSLNSGARLMAKHKSDAFAESRTPQPRPGDPAKQKLMTEASEYASEYVVMNRLQGIIGKMQSEEVCIENTGKIIKAMINDVLVEEPPPEHMDAKILNKVLGRASALLFKRYLERQMRDS